MSVLAQALGTQKARRANDYYPTIDLRCVPALLAAMQAVGDGWHYAEPCAGTGDLIHLLRGTGLECLWGLEIDPPEHAPKVWPIARGNALQLTHADCEGVDCFITNPPWTRSTLHALIAHLARLRPVWMLFDASWAHTMQASPLAHACTDIASVGRLKWFEHRPRRLRLPGETEADHAARMARQKAHDPPTDCAWYRFDLTGSSDGCARPRFHFPVARDRGRQPALL